MVFEDHYHNEPDRDDYVFPTAAEIRRSMQEWGLTPAELSSLFYAERVDQESRNTTRQEYIDGTPGGPMLDTLTWEQERLTDLKTNFVYGMWLDDFLFKNIALTFDEWAQVTAGRALIRLMTRARGAHAMLRELFPDDPEHAPSFEDMWQFVAREGHREKDHLAFLADLYTEVPNSDFAVKRIITHYSEAVRQIWETNRMRDESPLPDGRDWLFIDSDLTPRERAVEAVLAGMPINRAAGEYGISNRTLLTALADNPDYTPRKRGRRAVSV